MAFEPAAPTSASDPALNLPATPYRVLARKYRPTRFDELIGQEAMVRTLTNAIASGRLAHAFILTGVRGVGKTTTARILARGLNCTGLDGQGGPTPDPCGVCPNCIAIGEDRHVDVLEMDAASRTGIADIRELLDGVRYRPVAARYKIYILDEVHMLSDKAFNALLKTLEEPPPEVKFIFATTEIRKVPVTVLSRCQRFDLRRLDVETLSRHFARIAEAEGVGIEPGALALVARAADGSVRDGLSMLDQAIALSEGVIGEELVRNMLGLADRARVFDLFERAMRGDAAGALGLLNEMYAAGADPLAVLQDLLELNHWLTRLKVVPQAAEGGQVPEMERVRGKALAEPLTMAALTRAWQILLKGIAEVQAAPLPMQATEMLVIRLAFAAQLPSPAELVATLQESGPERPGRPVLSGAPRGGGQPAGAADSAPGGEGRPARAPRSVSASGPATATRAALATELTPEAMLERPTLPAPQNFTDVVLLCAERREPILQTHLTNHVHLVHFEPGRIELRPQPHAPANLASRLGGCLSEWTGRRWVIAIASEGGAPTLSEQAETAAAQERQEVVAHPLVQAVLASFPGATIDVVRSLAPAATVASAVASEAEPDGNSGDESA